MRLLLVFFFLNLGRKRVQSSVARLGSLASSRLIISVFTWYTGWMFFMQSITTVRSWGEWALRVTRE